MISMGSQCLLHLQRILLQMISDSDYSGDDDDDSIHKREQHHGPNKFVLGVAIALSSIVFLIVFLILCSKCCR